MGKIADRFKEKQMGTEFPLDDVGPRGMKSETEVIHFATGLHEVKQIMYYDGPLLSHYMDDQGRDWIITWTDVEWKGVGTPNPTAHDFWYALQISKADLAEYFANRITSLDVMQRANLRFLCEGWDVTNGIGQLVSFEEIPESRRPTVDSFLDDYAPTTESGPVEPSSPGEA